MIPRAASGYDKYASCRPQRHWWPETQCIVVGGHCPATETSLAFDVEILELSAVYPCEAMLIGLVTIREGSLPAMIRQKSQRLISRRRLSSMPLPIGNKMESNSS